MYCFLFLFFQFMLELVYLISCLYRRQDVIYNVIGYFKSYLRL